VDSDDILSFLFIIFCYLIFLAELQQSCTRLLLWVRASGRQQFKFPDDNSHILNRIGMKLGYMVTYKVRKNPNVFGVIVSKVKVTAAKNRLKMG